MKPCIRIFLTAAALVAATSGFAATPAELLDGWRQAAGRPSADARRFTDAAKAEKWFRRNCNDVLGRECMPGEKAAVVAWLLALKP